jgi:hypothetical protein
VVKAARAAPGSTTVAQRVHRVSPPEPQEQAKLEAAAAQRAALPHPLAAPVAALVA